MEKDHLIGQMLDNRYEILEVIGVGGMAVVYKAKCHRLNRFVAVKVLKSEYADDEDFRRQFYDESQAVAMLSHPNIVNVYDVSRSSGFEYIVMELIEGITLKDYLSRRGRLTPREIVVFASQIARALEHAHGRGIIHRDIKPQNIMLLRDGTVKVADFGIARQMNRTENTYNRGEAIGSVHYVSPEQARGSHIDNRTDLYSLGVVMYEMMTGRLPFEGETPVSVALQHINSMALPPSALVDDADPELEAITMKAMNPDLSTRYTTATELLEDLQLYGKAHKMEVNLPNAPRAEEKIEQSAPVAQPDEVTATRRIQNTGEVKKNKAAASAAEPANGTQRIIIRRPKEEKPVDKEERAADRRSRRSFSASLIFTVIAIAVFIGGAIYFINSVINPFDEIATDDKPLVPYLVGTMFSEAEYTVTDFTVVDGEWVYDDKVPYGQITAQSPAANRPYEIGGTITVTVSRGPKDVRLPNCVNSDAKMVRNELSRMGLEVVSNEEYNDEIESGCVISTTPAAGAALNPGDTVVLVVSKGPEPVPVKVPDLNGLSENEARSALEGCNLVCGGSVYIESERPAGQVVFQTIPAWSTVDSGTLVEIYISKGSTPVVTEPEPPVQGDTSGGETSGTGEEQTPPETETKPPRTGSGTSYDPYADADDRCIQAYKVSLQDSGDGVEVEVLVNGKTEYVGTHYAEESPLLTVRLTAPAGSNTVVVYQNGVLTAEEELEFE